MVKAAVDKWKQKKWFEIIAPAIFNDKKIGETMAADYRMILGRDCEIPLSDVSGDPKQQRIKLLFKIRDVKGERALTDYLGHKITQDYERSLARRRVSKLYSNQAVETKDGKKVAVKVIVVTFGKVNESIKGAIRKKLVEVINHTAKDEALVDFIHGVLQGRLTAKLKKELHKVHPIRHAVIQKAEIIREMPAE
ncbi:TPA: 30S ribosomal protein S3ae [archaeon]|nr:30S ribosomal protein S3ae [Candidatus Naiadarchaeales archaeon SRR2090153.bin461]HIK02394.1 30S ribosomal protein S3ae [Candidatus Naiadarchaeales archaeon SRR2090159.bin1288]